MPKKDLLSILAKFVANNPKKYFLFMGFFWIALGIYRLTMGTIGFGHFWNAVLDLVPTFGFMVVGIAYILIGVSKKQG